MVDSEHVHIQRVAERCNHEDCVLVRKTILTKKKASSRRATKRYAALDTGLAPDCPGLEDRESLRFTSLVKVENPVEIDMIHCLEMAVYETLENRQTKRI